MKTSALSELDIGLCITITNSSILSLAEYCGSRLISLYLDACRCITDESVYKIAEKCRNLQNISLSSCTAISTDAIMKLSEKCRKLLKIFLCRLDNVTDTCVKRLVSRCTELQTLGLIGCSNLTESVIINLRQKYPKVALLTAVPNPQVNSVHNGNQNLNLTVTHPIITNRIVDTQPTETRLTRRRSLLRNTDTISSHSSTHTTFSQSHHDSIQPRSRRVSDRGQTI
jgi:hypothetical protein